MIAFIVNMYSLIVYTAIDLEFLRTVLIYPVYLPEAIPNLDPARGYTYYLFYTLLLILLIHEDMDKCEGGGGTYTF